MKEFDDELIDVSIESQQIVDVSMDAQLSNEGFFGALKGAVIAALFHVTLPLVVPIGIVHGILKVKKIKELKSEIEHTAQLYSQLRDKQIKNYNPVRDKGPPPVALTAMDIIKGTLLGGIPIASIAGGGYLHHKEQELKKQLWEKYAQLKEAVAEELSRNSSEIKSAYGYEEEEF